MTFSPGPRMGTRRNACAASCYENQKNKKISAPLPKKAKAIRDCVCFDVFFFLKISLISQCFSLKVESANPVHFQAAQAATARFEASLIDTHRLLVIGGSDGCSDLESTELLDLRLGGGCSSRSLANKKTHITHEAS